MHQRRSRLQLHRQSIAVLVGEGLAHVRGGFITVTAEPSERKQCPTDNDCGPRSNPDHQGKTR